MGPQAYQLLRNSISLSMLNDKTFAQLVEVLKNHYNPKPSFNLRVKRPVESIATYLAELRA